MAQNSEKTAKPKKRGQGRPFQKGDDPRRNKGGRPRIPDDVKIALARLWPIALNTLERIIKTGDDAAKIKAIQIILDRTLGTASDSGVIEQIENATVETDEIISVIDSMDTWTTHRRIPDEELKKQAKEAVNNTIDEISNEWEQETGGNAWEAWEEAWEQE